MDSAARVRERGLGAALRAAGALLIVSILPVVPPTPVRAMVPPMRGPVPAAVQRGIEERAPKGFRHAYIEQARRLKQNRRLVEQELLRPRTDAELMHLTAVTGDRYLPVLLGKFSDTDPAADEPINEADLQRELDGGPWPAGTMSEYFSEVSYGNLQLHVNVFDWVPTSETGAHYAGASSGLSSDDAHTGQFITEVLEARDGGVDFGQYDNDGPDGNPNSGDDDGIVDCVVIVHPEIDGACGTGTIWSHHSTLSDWPEGPFVTGDPWVGHAGQTIKVDDYVICPALCCNCDHAFEIVEIGVFCHEYVHSFGLYDLYDTCSSNGWSAGAGYWSLMAYGVYNTKANPAHLSAWEKAELGWLTPATVAADLLNWPIAPSEGTPNAFKLWKDGTPGPEYFLVEYRKRPGLGDAWRFDQALLGQCLLIWHVDEDVPHATDEITLANYCTAANADETHKVLDLECADQVGADHEPNTDDLDAYDPGPDTGNRGDAGDPFSDGDAFTEGSTPSSEAYDEGPGPVRTRVRVQNIRGCGNAYVLADLIVAVDPAADNICIRDCDTDVCAGEISPCASWWRSPDIYVDNNEDMIADAPAKDIRNKLFARVRNPGATDAVNVDVAFYFADPAMGLRFPSAADLIDRVPISIIGSGTSVATHVEWTIPDPPPEVNHYCIGVIAENAEDPQNAERPNEDDNVAQINVQALYEKAGDAVPPGPAQPARGVAALGVPVVFQATRVVQVCNPLNQTCFFNIVIGSPPTYNDEVIPPDWMVGLEFTNVVLAPGQCRSLRVGVRDNDAVHLDQAIVPLTLLCGTTPVGGDVLEFHIDNVRPRPPCPFEVARLAPESDTRPSIDRIRIKWLDDFVDELGFPERVERWRIYCGNSPDFVPAPGNLLVETCLDDDPTTLPYEHYADNIPDPTHVWFKIIAVDRAGNASDPCVTQLHELTEVEENPIVKGGVRLAQNFPNPARGATAIVYALPRDGEVALEVYSLDGRLAKTLARGRGTAGTHRVVWDGVDEVGRALPSGFYVYRLRYGELQQSRRMLLLK